MIDRIDHIVLNCRNVVARASWYERALGFRREAHSSRFEPPHRASASCSNSASQFHRRQTGDTSWWICKVDAMGSLDLCFVTEVSLKPVITARGRRHCLVAGPGALGPMTSINCEDPDGNLVEVSTYARDGVA